ncbi:hypothetical protein VIGAN_04078200 [Vigna angularis var. angularis]|uniref:Lon N-terminal domain-containing protein n=1 Tax=Vigna angularis var. angularis TaxID=157739 RepID=A0A0S3RSR4_PHAAN|nr:hypothetical protein VIGAN_04078200 [Vigna angularis var. angularis]
MMHTLFQTDLHFGVIYTNVVSGTAAVGCVGEVIKHESLVDGRFFLIRKGQERFRVNTMVRTKEVGDLRRNLFPTTFSFFVGSIFEGAPRE